MSKVTQYLGQTNRRLLSGILAGALIAPISLSAGSQAAAAEPRAATGESSAHEFKQRSISVLELGQMTIYPDPNGSWSFSAGPKGTRSVTNFKGAEWIGDGIHAKSVWGNGTYLSSPEGIAEVTVRVMFKTDDGALIYVDYLARFDWDEQETGVVSGPLMTGRVETNAERYQWLNKIQIIGKGSFADGQTGKMQMRYQLYALPNSAKPDFE